MHQLHLSHRITAISIIPIIIPTTITKIMIIMKIKIIIKSIISFEPTGSALHLGRLEEGDGGVYRCQVDYSQVMVMVMITVTILKMPMQNYFKDANATQF